MLVCSVVLRPQRHTVAADIIEVAEAFDFPTTGTIFATLTDDPGNARDVLDAFTGARLVEAANAAEVVDALSSQPATILEEISAAVAAQDASVDALTEVFARDAMAETVLVNSDGTPRQANADGVMINL